MSIQSNHTQTKIIQLSHSVRIAASVLIGFTFFGGAAITANADASNGGQLSGDNYTLPVPNDEGNVVEQQITQNIIRNVNVIDANGQSQTQTQETTLNGSQLLDQTHGVVLEGHVGPAHWRTVNLPINRHNNVNSVQVSNTVTPTTKQDRFINSSNVVNSLVNTQKKNYNGPAAVYENQSAIQLSTSTHQVVKDEATKAPKSNHLAGAGIGILGVVTMLAGLAGWKKHSK